MQSIGPLPTVLVERLFCGLTFNRAVPETVLRGVGNLSGVVMGHNLPGGAGNITSCGEIQC